MRQSSSSAFLAAVLISLTAGASIPVDKSNLGLTFDGLGGLSGGGATTRLLVDYDEQTQGEVLDYLFKPNYGANLQILKVEIGGDSQSTDGTESSHMHSKDDLDLHRGYEWWLMAEAKKRNPDIKLYGLPWAYPGWVGNDPATGKPSGSPFTFPDQTSTYIKNWIVGAKSEYNLTIDYIGIWNERSSDATYAKTLRSILDNNGCKNTKIVAKDGGADICDSMAKDPAYAASVDIIGLHYPSDYKNYSVCQSFKKPFWASEESSSYDDLNGAACWARVVNSHYVLSGMTSSIMWNLVGSYYHGTNWYASSMMNADQPWSGHYDVMPVIWATAHITQFTKVGWKYLAVGSGSGQLPAGGFYATWVDPAGDDFTMNIVKIDHDHAPCTRPKLPDFNVSAEAVEFSLAPSMKVQDGASLQVWHSNFQDGQNKIFEQLPPVKVSGGKFSLQVAVGDFYTVSTITTAKKGTSAPKPSSPQFPLPHSDDFEAVVESQEAKYWADQIGAFEVHGETMDGDDNTNKTRVNKVMRMMVPQLPIGWSDHGSNGPMTLIGMREWQDITISVDFKLPATPSSPANAGCVATRIDQMWKNGIVVCVSEAGSWELAVGGPKLGTANYSEVIKFGSTAPLGTGKWHTLSLTTVGQKASGSLDSASLFTDVAIRDTDTGFGAIGANDWFPIEYDNVKVSQAGDNWHPVSPPGCAAGKAGTKVGVRKCSVNGIAIGDIEWILKEDWTLLHKPSGLCAAASGTDAGATLSLQTCDPKDHKQQFRNDYTRIRNGAFPIGFMTDSYYDMSGLRLVGSFDGTVNVGKQGNHGGDWNTWSYFPNTNQLRSQYVVGSGATGFPMCLSICPAAQ